MVDRSNSRSGRQYDPVFALSRVNSPSRDADIAAHETQRYEAAHPDFIATLLAAEIESERLAALRAERVRANEEKRRAVYLTEKQVSVRRIPLTALDRLQFAIVVILSVLGVFAATYALAVYAAESGVIAALDNNILAAVLMSFPVLAAGQAVKAAGALQKDDAAKALYFTGLFKFGAVAFCLFVTGALIAFAPHQTDLSAIQDVLTSGASNAPSGMAVICKAVGPYLAVGGGLLSEVAFAAVLSHRADAMNAIGRDVSQDIAVTQHVLDQRLGVLHRQIETYARKAGRLQATINQHKAALTAQIEAAQAYARELAAQYAAFESRSRRDFLTQLSTEEV